jgi:uncharacterized protein YbcI
MTNEELNAKAAEIMGWKQVHSIQDETDIVKSLNSPIVLQREDGIIVYALEEDLYTPIWNPCNNKDQALDLVEIIRNKTLYTFEFKIASRVESCAKYTAYFGRGDKQIRASSMNSLALAITRACIRAMEEWEKAIKS